MGVQDREWFREDRARKEAIYGDGSNTPIRNTPPSVNETQGRGNLLETLGGALFKIVGMVVIVFLIVVAFWLFVAFTGIRF